MPGSAPASPDRGRGFSVRASVVAFGVMVGTVVAATAGLLVLLDPRAQAFWAGRLSEAVTAVRSLLGR